MTADTPKNAGSSGIGLGTVMFFAMMGLAVASGVGLLGITLYVVADSGSSAMDAEWEAILEPIDAPIAAVAAPQVGGTAMVHIVGGNRMLVVIDGKGVGFTPVVHELDAGTHTLKVSVSGDPYSAETREITVQGGQEYTFEF